jgi:hypothetical protein
VPVGDLRGKRVKLLPEERNLIRRIYDGPDAGPSIQDMALASYLTLAHLCGPPASQQLHFRPKLELPDGEALDALTLWAAASPRLRAELRVEGDNDSAITCPHLGTRYPVAA